MCWPPADLGLYFFFLNKIHSDSTIIRVKCIQMENPSCCIILSYQNIVGCFMRIMTRKQVNAQCLSITYNSTVLL